MPYRVLADYYHLLRKMGNRLHTQNTGGKTTPPFYGGNPEKGLCGLSAGLFSLENSPKEQKSRGLPNITSEIAKLERRVKIMAEKKPTNRERLQEITAGIEQGIKELFESEKYMRYLSVMSKFHRYSVNNTMLIYMQKPDATLWWPDTTSGKTSLSAM